MTMVQKRVMRVLLVAAASMMVAACGGKVRSEFVAGCKSQGAPESKCDCLYGKLEDKYGVDGLEAMQKGEAMLPGFVEASAVGAAQCSGVDPSIASKQLGIEDKSSEVTNRVLSEPVAQHVTANASIKSEDEKTPAQDVQASDDAVIENTIAITASSEIGDEYKDARKVAVGDLNGDGANDAAALFTIEVGSQNTSTQYLSAFLRQDDGVLKFAGTTPVGGTGNAISEVAVEEGAVKLKALTLGPDDADCCPSVEEKVEYLLHNGKLKRVN
jgi:hypothetical protein